MKKQFWAMMTAITVLTLGMTSTAYSQLPLNGLTDPNTEVCWVTILGTAHAGVVTKNNDKLLKCEAPVPENTPRHDRSPQDGELFSCTNGIDTTIKWQIHVNGQGIAKLSCHF